MIGAVDPPADDEIVAIERVAQADQVARIALPVGVDACHEVGRAGPQPVRDRPRVALPPGLGEERDRERRGERPHDRHRGIGRAILRHDEAHRETCGLSDLVDSA